MVCCGLGYQQLWHQCRVVRGDCGGGVEARASGATVPGQEEEDGDPEHGDADQELGDDEEHPAARPLYTEGGGEGAQHLHRPQQHRAGAGAQRGARTL